MIDIFYFSWSRLIIYFFLPAISCCVFILLFFSKNDTKINSVIILVSLVFSLYLGEIILSYYPVYKHNSWIENQTDELGYFDSRPQLEVVIDLINKGKQVYPMTFSANSNIPLKINGVNRLGLSGVANAEMLFCNETGKWLSIETDELGFRNPKGIWNNTDFDILLIGDSYGQGTCVKEPESIAGLVRKSFKKTINLSHSMNGPLIQLAILKEYGEILKPKKVIWFFYANDLFDMTKNINNSILSSYLNENFSQNLYKDREKINASIKILSNQIIEDYKTGKIQPKKPRLTIDFPVLKNILKFSATRKALQFPHYYEGIIDVDYKLYEKLFKLSVKQVSRWNGEIIFVYLPSYNELAHYKKTIIKREYDLQRESLFPLIKKTNTSFLDMTPIFHSLGDANDFYHTPISHYNEKGYKIVSEAILKRLKEHF